LGISTCIVQQNYLGVNQSAAQMDNAHSLAPDAPAAWIIHDYSTVRQTNKVSRPAKAAAEKVFFDHICFFRG
jgi:hypothetical protein